MKFADAAYRVLEGAGKPLWAVTIVEKAIAGNYFN